jgi:hypothetical protein
MNKLYIGPYNQNTYIGHISRYYLDSILSQSASGSDFAYRPIYITESFRIGEDSAGIIHEKNTIIQNVPLDYFVPYTDFDKNIFIPIIEHNKDINISYKDTLNKSDKILVSNPIDYMKIVSCGVDTKKINMFYVEPKIHSQFQNKKIDLGLYDDLFKFYFIGDYVANKRIIKTIMIAFLSAFRTNNNACLVLWINTSNDNAEELFLYYQNLKKQMRLNNYFDKIIFVNRPLNLYETPLLHTNANVFLALNDDHYPIIDEQYAILYKNTIMTKNHLQLAETYDVDRMDYSVDGHIKNITIDSLSEQMLRKFDQKESNNKPILKNKSNLLSLL